MNHLAMMAFASVLSLWMLSNLYLKVALKNLEKSREYRTAYMDIAKSLVEDRRFPESKAVEILKLSSNSPGMINAKIFFSIVMGQKINEEYPEMDDLHSRKYREAVRNLILSSSYRSLIIGPLIRKFCSL